MLPLFTCPHPNRWDLFVVLGSVHEIGNKMLSKVINVLVETSKKAIETSAKDVAMCGLRSIDELSNEMYDKYVQTQNETVTDRH